MNMQEIMSDESTMLPKTGAEVSKKCEECGDFFLTVRGHFCGTCQSVAVVKIVGQTMLAQRWNVLDVDYDM